ncbi:MAG TPA: hypothetical protein VGN26_23990 [Armatimonadota bacterium]
MGFTPFPYDATPAAEADLKTFLRTNSDIIAQHIEGVPWTEAAEGKPFHPKLMEDWQRRRRLTPPGAATYLAVSPGRGDLAPYRAQSEGLPLPAAFAGKSFDDPLVMRAYLAYCLRAVGYFHPNYLAIGIEVNEIRNASPSKWAAYAKLHRYVYGEVKRKYPKLPVLASFTLHNLYGPPPKTDALKAFQGLMDCNDLVAVSFYPFLGGHSGRIEQCFAWLQSQFDRYRKPYAFVETGEAAERLELPSAHVSIEGTPEKQRDYYARLLALAQRRRFAFVITFLYRDYDALWERIKATAPELFLAWRDCGLLDEAGRPRPAYVLWQRAFRRP